MNFSYPESIIKTHFFDFNLDKATQVNITIHDIGGRIVLRLVDSVLDKGDHEVFWHAVDSHGEPFPAGLYYFIMNTDEFRAIKTFTIIK